MKKVLLGVVAVAVLAALALMLNRSGDGPSLPVVSHTVESALPSVADDRTYVLVRMENPELLERKLDIFAAILPQMAEADADFSGKPTEENAAEAAGWLRHAGDLMALFDEAAVLAVSDDATVYMSFLVNDEKFGAFIGGTDPAYADYAVEAWQTDKHKGRGEAWIMTSRDATNAGKRLYAVRPDKDARLVVASDNADSLDPMFAAMQKTEARFAIKRENAGPDYVQVRMPVKSGEADEAKMSLTEIAWVEDEQRALIQVHSNYHTILANRPVPRSGLESLELPILGDGEVAAMMGLDIPYLCFSVFPGEPDPVEYALSLAGREMPDQYKQDIAAIMKEGRIFGVVVMDGQSEEPNTAYLLLETKAKSSMDKFFGLATFFMQPATLDGWDDALALDPGTGINVVAARKGDYYLLGIGATEDYAKSAATPKGIADFAVPQDLVSFVATSAMLEAAGSSLGREVQKNLLRRGLPVGILEALDLDALDALQMRLITPEKASIGIYWDRTQESVR